jgi:hypothetical protein
MVSLVGSLILKLGAELTTEWRRFVCAVLLLAAACGDGSFGSYKVLNTRRVEFNPDQEADVFTEIGETSQAVAQTFQVLWEDCVVNKVKLAVTQGESQDTGLVSVDIRPTDEMRAPDASSSSVLSSLQIDTSELPAAFVDEFTTFDFSKSASELSVAFEQFYAVVVEFVSRDGSLDSLPIAAVLGADGAAEDPYPQGEGFTGASDIAFSPTLDDYFFEIRLLCEKQ